MREYEAQNLIRIFGGRDMLVSALCITEFSEELQLEIVTHFSENIFKHILLHVPSHHIERVIDVLDAHAEEGSNFDELLIILDQHIPNTEASVTREVGRMIEKFRSIDEASANYRANETVRLIITR